MITRSSYVHVAIQILALSLLSACSGDDTEADAGVELNDFGLAIIPCPENLEFSIDMESTGEEGLVVGRVVDADPAPPERYRNDWTVQFLDADGEPLDDVQITRSRAFMPAHNHDGTFPTDVSELQEPGLFQVDNLNMFMGGPWEVQLWVELGGQEDYIVFDVCIPE